MMNSSLFSSKNMAWNTPSEVLDIVRTFAPIGLDPCSNERSTVRAPASFLSGGLEVSWADYGAVFVNPPYGRALREWAEKIAYEAAKGVEIVALVPSRTDTRWFQLLAAHANVICFWKGRITFEGAPHPAPFPSAMIYFGPRSARFRTMFKDCGLLV